MENIFLVIKEIFINLPIFWLTSVFLNIIFCQFLRLNLQRGAKIKLNWRNSWFSCPFIPFNFLINFISLFLISVFQKFNQNSSFIKNLITAKFLSLQRFYNDNFRWFIWRNFACLELQSNSRYVSKVDTLSHTGGRKNYHQGFNCRFQGKENYSCCWILR